MVSKLGPYFENKESNLKRGLDKKSGTLIEKEGLTKKSGTLCGKGGL